MPHVGRGGSSGEDADLASQDEVRVFKDEGEGEIEDRPGRLGSAVDGDDPTQEINELKHSLIDEDERDSRKNRPAAGSTSGTQPSSRSKEVSSCAPRLVISRDLRSSCES